MELELELERRDDELWQVTYEGGLMETGALKIPWYMQIKE